MTGGTEASTSLSVRGMHNPQSKCLLYSVCCVAQELPLSSVYNYTVYVCETADGLYCIYKQNCVLWIHDFHKTLTCLYRLWATRLLVLISVYSLRTLLMEDSKYSYHCWFMFWHSHVHCTCSCSSSVTCMCVILHYCHSKLGLPLQRF